MIKIVVLFLLANGHAVYFEPHVRFSYGDQCKAVVDAALPALRKGAIVYFKQPVRVGIKCTDAEPEA